MPVERSRGRREDPFISKSVNHAKIPKIRREKAEKVRISLTGIIFFSITVDSFLSDGISEDLHTERAEKHPQQESSFFYAVSHSVAEEEEKRRKHGNDEDDQHDVDESASHKVHIAHEIADHDIYGGPEGVTQKHEEGDVHKADIGEACSKWG